MGRGEGEKGGVRGERRDSEGERGGGARRGREEGERRG